MPELSFKEIEDWRQFENLIAAFFESLKNAPGTNITEINVKQSGDGPDGGKDIIVDMDVTDFIAKSFRRRWLIQCKFNNRAIGLKDINTVNIPTLIHSQSACGYLLICGGAVTSGLEQYIANLNKQDVHFKYHYEVWNGDKFKGKLYVAAPTIHQQFFPHFYQQVTAQK